MWLNFPNVDHLHVWYRHFRVTGSVWTELKTLSTNRLSGTGHAEILSHFGYSLTAATLPVRGSMTTMQLDEEKSGRGKRPLQPPSKWNVCGFHAFDGLLGTIELADGVRTNEPGTDGRRFRILLGAAL